MTMNRRGFLSWLGLGAVAALIPSPIKALVEKALPKRWAGWVVVDPSGLGDFTDIQSALDALPSAGGTVFVCPGLYTFPILLQDGRPVSIIGLGDKPAELNSAPERSGGLA